MKRKLFLLGALALIVASGLFWSCQKEELLNPEDAMLKKGKVAATEDVSPFTWVNVCAGEDLVVTLNGTGNRQIQQLIDGDWINQGNEPQGDEPIVFTIEDVDAGTYYFRYKVGSGGFSAAVMIVIEECCTPGFTYVDNLDGTYTFTLIPDADVLGAELVFTFAQSAYVSGLPVEEGWMQNGNEGQTMKTTMDLLECNIYTWTVTLTANCSGKSGQSNVWTDFKVNDLSQKADPEDKFIQTCPAN